MGVRGIKLQKNDRIISSSILNSIEINTDEREEYIKYSNSLRNDKKSMDINKERLEILSKEEFLLSVTENGFVKGLLLLNIEKLKEEDKNYKH